MFCKKCGSENSNEAKFCKGCGNVLEGANNNSKSIQSDAKTKKTLFALAGGALVFGSYIKLRTGYYERELPLYIGILIVGCILAYISTKIKIEK